MREIGTYAFVDDSGDPGTKSPARDHFLLGGYFLKPGDEAALRLGLLGARTEFGMQANQVLHFTNYGHNRRLRLAEIVAGFPITSFAGVLCKQGGPEKRPWGTDRLYNWMLKLSVERCSWYFKRQGTLGSVTIEHQQRMHVDGFHEYVDRLKSSGDSMIEWDYLHLPVRFMAKGTDERLQPADTIASATGLAFQQANGNPCTQAYFRKLAPTFWRAGGQLDKYGLKIQPGVGCQPPCPEDHSWVSQLR